MENSAPPIGHKNASTRRTHLSDGRTARSPRMTHSRRSGAPLLGRLSPRICVVDLSRFVSDGFQFVVTDPFAQGVEIEPLGQVDSAGIFDLAVNVLDHLQEVAR